jgi:uncharacterized protein YbjT (DUF2867 family)
MALSSGSASPRSVAILGASGLVGRALITSLLAEPAYAEIHLLVRRPLADLPADPRLQQHPFDPNTPDDWQHLLRVDTVFCCLGTTIKIAGSQAAFRAVDHELVLTAAKRAKQMGAQHFLVISALGANAQSRVFYNRIKGEMEADLQALQLPRLSIFRPSLLAGARSEIRLGEKLGLLLGSWLPLPWRPIHDHVVAHAMCWASRTQHETVRVFSSADMQRLARQRTPR